MNEQNSIFYELLFSQPVYLIPEKPAAPEGKTVQHPVLVVATRLPLSATEEELLEKILQAAKINPTEVDKITITDYQSDSNSDRSYILFFVRPQLLPKELAVFGMYTQAPAYEKAHVIIANDLTELSADTPGKKKLWELLKQTFLK